MKPDLSYQEKDERRAKIMQQNGVVETGRSAVVSVYIGPIHILRAFISMYG